MSDATIQATVVEDGQVLRLALAAPPRNVLDGAMLDALREAITRHALGEPARRRKAILLCAEGPSFSLGASVAEHAPAEAPAMLARFHAAVRALVAADLPIVAAVRGHCLGGGLELVLPAAHVVAHVDAKLGQPEIRLAAFAPVASLLLPRRLGQARAEALLLSGRVVDAAEALRLGLVDEVVEGEPVDAALAWIRAALLPHSATALRIATRAARAALHMELERLLPRLERMYVEELAPSHDAGEGVAAFLARRPPRWEDR